MRKMLVALVMAFVLMAGIAGSNVAADGHQFPAQNESACTAAGGEFNQDGPTRTCVVDGAEYTETDVVTKVAGKSGRSWTIDYTIQTTTIYIRNGSELTTSSSSNTVVTGCLNPAGNPVDPSLSDNCQVPS